MKHLIDYSLMFIVFVTVFTLGFSFHDFTNPPVKCVALACRNIHCDCLNCKYMTSYKSGETLQVKI